MNRKSYIISGLVLLLIISLVVFIFFFDKDKEKFNNKDRVISEIKEKNVYFPFIIGELDKISKQELTLKISDRDMNSINKYINNNYKLEENTEIYIQKSDVKTAKEFDKEQNEFINKHFSDKNAEAPSWFKLERASLGALNAKQRIKVYYDSFENTLIAKKIVILNEKDDYGDYKDIKSDLIRRAEGEIIKVEKEGEYKIKTETSSFYGTREIENFDILVEFNTKYLKKIKKSEQVFNKEQEEFNKKLVESKGDKKIQDDLKAPEWFYYENADLSDLVLRKKILVLYSEINESGRVVAIEVHILN